MTSDSQIHLHILVEGETEEGFVQQILKEHLWRYEIHVFSVNLGGWNSFQKAKAELCRWVKQKNGSHCWFTSMLDLYALPEDFPGKKDAGRITDPYKEIEFLESKFSESIITEKLWRFIPYLQLHEFEALILTNPQALGAEFLNDADGKAIERLAAMAAKFVTPEHINEGPETAPSKRIIAELPRYEKLKAKSGPSIAELIGLPVLRQRCRHFGAWLTRLEKLSGAPRP